LARTSKSLPRYLLMVLAFAGDSTTTTCMGAICGAPGLSYPKEGRGAASGASRSGPRDFPEYVLLRLPTPFPGVQGGLLKPTLGTAGGLRQLEPPSGIAADGAGSALAQAHFHRCSPPRIAFRQLAGFFAREPADH